MVSTSEFEHAIDDMRIQIAGMYVSGLDFQVASTLLLMSMLQSTSICEQ
jgi:hypothetical protein